jgi:hypothetical protein
MRVARNARCSFRSPPARQNSNRNSRFTGFELSCGKQSTKQFSNRNKNGFSGIPAPSLHSYLRFTPKLPFRTIARGYSPAPGHSANLRNCPRRLG